MSTTPPPSYLHSRAHPRLKVATLVQVWIGTHSFVCKTLDISIGGLSAKCPQAPSPETRLRLLLNLPNGSSVLTEGLVCYAHEDRFGVRFTSLHSESQQALEDYTRRTLDYTRTGGRIAKRVNVTLLSILPRAEEQLAETVGLSRNGGLLICRARFRTGEELRLRWPERNRTAQIRIVFDRLCGAGELIELGFVFLDCDDFWQIEFPSS